MLWHFDGPTGVLGPPVILLLTVPGLCIFCKILFVICVSCLAVSYCLVCSMQPCGNLLGKG